MPATVLVLGADGMDPGLIVRGIESGRFPNLARLGAHGATGRVINPPRFFSGASWPCFYTGVRPARHDQYLRTHYDPRTCVHRPVRPARNRAEPFWRGPGWDGKRTAVIDMPYGVLDKGIHGLQISEWGVHDRHRPSMETWPPELAGEVVSRFGKEPVGLHCSQFDGRDGLSELRDRLLRRVRTKRDMICHYLGAEPWELFIGMFDDAHCAAHRFWHLHDPTHVRHDPELAGALGDVIGDVYAEIDRSVGAAVALANADATVIFVSSHGMTNAYDATSVFDEILRRIEGLAPRASDYEEQRVKQLAGARSLSDRLPASVRRVLAPARRRFGRTQLHRRMEEERRGRKCFWMPTHDTWSGIRVNLVGREEPGVVRPGDDYERFVEQLTRDLHELRDGDSGALMVGEVVRAADVDHRGYAGELPDLIVHWSTASSALIESPKVGRLPTRMIDGRTGDHDPAMLGIFFAAGPSVTPGSLSRPIRFEDFAPTISGLVRADAGDTDGTAVREICASDRARAAVR